jgi:hypothetical protein
MDAMKLYQKKEVAQQIAEKLTKKDGKAREVIEVNGQFQIVTEQELEQVTAPVETVQEVVESPPQEPTTQEEVKTILDGTQANHESEPDQITMSESPLDVEKPAQQVEQAGDKKEEQQIEQKAEAKPFLPPKKEEKDQLLEIFLAAAYKDKTNKYLITPPIEGKPRWFLLHRLNSVEFTVRNGQKGAKVVLPAKELHSRKLQSVLEKAEIAA